MVEINPEAVETPAHEQKPERKIDYFWPFKMERADAWMVAFTAIIALTGIAGFVILRGQLIAMQGQLDEMRSSGEDTKALVKAAQNSTKAAQDAVAVAKENSQRELRAYVLVDNASAILDGRTLKAVIEIKNFGRTPAYDFAFKIFAETKVVGIKTLPMFAEGPPTEWSMTIIGPGGTSIATPELTFPAENTA